MRRRPRLLAAAVVLATAAVGAGVSVAAPIRTGVSGAAQDSTTVVATAGGLQLARTAGGLLTDRPFTRPVSDRQLRDSFEFNGSASSSYAYVRDPGAGLRVGVNHHRESNFTGWFAVNVAAFPASSVFHVDMSRPPGNVTGTGNVGETVFAVQTASTKITGLINFVAVTSVSGNGVTSWQVGYSHGHIQGAKANVQWSSPARAHAPQSHEITVRTDGRHRLTVWFGDRRVFNSDHMNMNMEAPFQPYLEVQALRTGYVSRFTDFWVARTATITISGLPAGSRVSLRPTRGEARGSPPPLSSATASPRGTASLSLPPPSAKGRATLVATVDGHRLAFGPFDYAGGDHYQLRGFG